MTRHLSGPMTIAEVATLLGWEYERTRRVLLKLHEELNSMLLKRLPGFGQGVRYTVTLAALKKAAPQWFDEDALLLREQLEDVRTRLVRVESRQSMTESAVGGLHRRMNRAKVPA